MREFKRRVLDWFDHRTGLETAIRNFLYEDIPGSSGWHQVFGSVAVFLFMVQAFTGILLAFNYAATPGDAYNSLKYIIMEVTGGRLIHGLHHWGASMMIVVVVLHMTQVFLFGAYKKPREATWMVGVVLLLITLAYGLTGYLLPWDNRAYWGTVVTTQIASQVPLLGSYLKRFLGTNDGSVGVVTFARFYGLHVLILPQLTTLLIVFHIYLVRKHGVAPTPGDASPNKKFFPEQMLKDVVAVFAAFVTLYLMALFVAIPLDRLADPTDLTYIPRPDWYFLFLFQTLKFFKGSLEPVGTVLLPTLGVLALFLTPFMDRGKLVKLTQRTTAVGVFAFAAIAWGALTLGAIRSTPAAQEQANNPPQAAGLNQFSPQELAGLGYFRQEKCLACHNLDVGPPKAGPNLATAREHKNAAWMIKHFKNPNQVVPGTNMPPILLSDAKLDALASFLLKLTPDNASDVAAVPDNVVRGAQIYEAQACGNCHMVNGVGAKLGPPLNGLAQRRDQQWVEKHFADPAAMSSGSIMPPSQFSPADMQAIVDYLFSLPGA
ncbi:MAG: cytochrome b N-terminal domain-containing protein [Acidobacteriota bacterium]|nr:cytochrome b N-terminal domain-containing protein [Acidobacteriota bacterium]